MYFFYAIVLSVVIIVLIFLLKARQSRNYHWSKNLSSNCSNRFNIGLQLTNMLLILRVIIISTSSGAN